MIYTYIFEGGLKNSFFFETDFGLIYEIKFKPSSYIFENFNKDNIYEFVIELALNPIDNIPLDKKISPTVAAIFNEFMKQNDYNACVYICDSSDGKQDIRRRKFNDWFYKYQNDDFVKIDEKLKDEGDKLYPISFVVNARHPDLKEIISSFIDLIRMNKK